MSAVASNKHQESHPAPSKYGSNGALLRIPRTLADFRRWALSDEVPEKLPLGFINGEVFVDMSKEEIRTHALVKTAVSAGLFHLNEAINFGHLFINGVL